MALLQGIVTKSVPTASLPANTMQPMPSTPLGYQIASEGNSRYYVPTSLGSMFGIASPSAVTLSTGLATTYVGLCISNPVGSGKNVVINKVGYAFLVAFSSASAIGIAVGSNASAVTHTTPLTPQSLLVGSVATPIAKVDSAATLPSAPVLTHIIAYGLTGPITNQPIIPYTVEELEGSIILPPGAYASFYGSSGSGASAFMGSFQWEEVPV